MKIIAHRGAWCGDDSLGIPVCEKNSVQAFEIAVEQGFGIETDFRDICGKVVVSHNPPKMDALSAEDFFKLTRKDQIVAVNVKADGIADTLKSIWQSHAPTCRPFAFDMSVPDTLGYIKAGFPFFERRSEFEKLNVWGGVASGFWLDGFKSVWFDCEFIKSLLGYGQPVCIVSPELHAREFRSFWRDIKALVRDCNVDGDKVWLCTDQPFEAERYFLKDI